MESTKYWTFTNMEKWSNKGWVSVIPLLVYITLFFFIREYSLVNDELSLYYFLKDRNLSDLMSLDWSNAFKFKNLGGLSNTNYYRPLMNYIYYFGFVIYDLFSITPVLLNWFCILILTITVRKTISSLIGNNNKSYLVTTIYLLLPFNFEAALYFPNISDLLIQIVLFSLILIWKKNKLNSILYLLSFVLILIAFLVKEAAIILISIPILFIILNKSITKNNIDKKKTLNYYIIFFSTFIIYFFLRQKFVIMSDDELNIVTLIVNAIKGFINFIFFTQDINLIIIELISFSYFVWLLFKEKLSLIPVFSFVLSIPVAILLPDDRFFHISYFILLLFLISNKNKKLLVMFVILSFSAFSYKIIVHNIAKKIRIEAKHKFNLQMEEIKNLTLSILPYKEGNEAEIFFNGTNLYLEKESNIPILLKQRNLFKTPIVNIENDLGRIRLSSNSKLFIPHMKNDTLLLEDISIIQNVDNEILILYNRENINIYNYYNK